MTRSQPTNRRLAPTRRPSDESEDTTLRLETEVIPKQAKGQMLLRNEFLSLNP
jgi:NADPH-dependent curcumin reductase CurA